MEKARIYEDRHFTVGSRVVLDDNRRATIKEIRAANCEYVVELEDNDECIAVTLSQLEDY